MTYQFCSKKTIKKTDIIFLCGTSYKKKPYDKRVILKKFLNEQYPEKNILILEEHFIFEGNNSKYLNYDEIFMKNLNDIEILTASFASKIIIIHESISTGAELAAFASKKIMHNKICLLVPDETGIEEQKMSSFLRLAYFRKDSIIERITFYPETYFLPISEKHQEIRTNFQQNNITNNLGLKINKFINRNSNELIKKIIFTKMIFGKPNKNLETVSYCTNKNSGESYVSTQVIFYQIISFFQDDEFRREVRIPKKLTEHVDYIQNFYKETMKNTISELSGKHINSNRIYIKELDLGLREVIAFALYMYQAIGYIRIESIKESKRIVISSTFSDVVNTYKGLISKKKSYVILEK